MDRKTILYGLVGAAAVLLAAVSYWVYSGNSTPSLGDSGSLKVVLSPTDHAMGNPKAPLTVVEYGAPSCPVCAHWNDAVFPQFKANYIDTGKVYYVFRVYPLRPQDLAVSAMAHCLPKESYFSFIDMMWRNQSMWDPDGYQIADPQGALLHMGVIAGMTPQQAETCASDQQQLQDASAIGEYAQKNYGINSTPSFIVNGQLQPEMMTAEGMKDTLDGLLKAQASK